MCHNMSCIPVVSSLSSCRVSYRVSSLSSCLQDMSIRHVVSSIVSLLLSTCLITCLIHVLYSLSSCQCMSVYLSPRVSSYVPQQPIVSCSLLRALHLLLAAYSLLLYLPIVCSVPCIRVALACSACWHCMQEESERGQGPWRPWG